MHREYNSEMVNRAYENVRIERPLTHQIQEVRLRHQLMENALSEVETQLEESAC